MKITLPDGTVITGDNLVYKKDNITISQDKYFAMDQDNDKTPYGSYGIYIILKDKTYISKDYYIKDKHKPRGILVHTEKLFHELSLFDHPEKMTWNEAVKHSIPSKEQWEEISNYIEDIEEIIKLTGGDTLKDKWYWLSTEFSGLYTWSYIGARGGLSVKGKGINYWVRTFKLYSL